LGSIGDWGQFFSSFLAAAEGSLDSSGEGGRPRFAFFRLAAAKTPTKLAPSGNSFSIPSHFPAVLN
jgi:hypothetical protein